MADAVSTQIVHDGKRFTTMRFTNKSDATGEDAVQKVDISALAGAPSSVAIMDIWFATQGMAVELYWDADTDRLATVLPADMSDHHCYEKTGGLIMPADLTNPTGDIMFTTVGHGAGDSYEITLRLRKRGLSRKFS